MALDKLITDRTEDDVKNKTPKAYIDITDLQRIQSYIDYIAEQKKKEINKKEWRRGETINALSIKRYILDNVSDLRALFSWTVGSPTVPKQLLSYEDFNNLEKCIQAIYDRL